MLLQNAFLLNTKRNTAVTNCHVRGFEGILQTFYLKRGIANYTMAMQAQSKENRKNTFKERTG